MPNIVIRHLSGTKANQVEEIPLQGFREILIGREANSHVRFDADREDLVSRNHARVVRDPSDPNGFMLTDLDSRNGTFINRQRIYGASRLQHGDRIQLGPSGPEFTFEIDPPTAARPTRMAESTGAMPPTREAQAFSASTHGAAVPPGMLETRSVAPPPGKVGVGRETVERIVGDVAIQMKGESRRTMWTAVIGALVLLVAGAGYFVWDRQQKALDGEKAHVRDAQNAAVVRNLEAQTSGLVGQLKTLTATVAASRGKGSAADAKGYQEQIKTLQAQIEKNQLTITNLKNPPGPTEPGTGPGGNTGPGGTGSNQPPADLTADKIHADNVKSVILIEATWKVTDSGTGAQVYLYHHKNDLGACPGEKSDYLPMFIDDQGTLSPVLSTLSNEGHNTPIVGTHSGSGFIVGGEGYFLTNRHVLAPWRSTWSAASFTKKTVGLKVKGNSIVGCITANEFPSAWVPSEGSKMVIDKMESVMNPKTGTASTTSTFSDRLKYNPLRTNVQGEAVLNVTFAKTTQRYRGTSVTVSEKHDVALGKVDLPGGGKAVTMNPDSDIKPGQPVVVMGYPAISPDAFGVEVSRDMFTNRAHYSAIADPTLTTGPISKVLASSNAVRGVDGYISSGEVYQLGINTTGVGNSGGPVFDSKGRVVAIFYAGSTGRDGTMVTYAVPVKFGKELIDNPSVMR